MSSSAYDACRTCGERAWTTTPDGRGGVVIAYNCTAETRVKQDGSVRVLKECPDWGKHAVREDP